MRPGSARSGLPGTQGTRKGERVPRRHGPDPNQGGLQALNEDRNLPICSCRRATDAGNRPQQSLVTQTETPRRWGNRLALTLSPSSSICCTLSSFQTRMFWILRKPPWYETTIFTLHISKLRPGAVQNLPSIFIIWGPLTWKGESTLPGSPGSQAESQTVRRTGMLEEPGLALQPRNKPPWTRLSCSSAAVLSARWCPWDRSRGPGW